MDAPISNWADAVARLCKPRPDCQHCGARWDMTEQIGAWWFCSCCGKSWPATTEGK